MVHNFGLVLHHLTLQSTDLGLWLGELAVFIEGFLLQPLIIGFQFAHRLYLHVTELLIVVVDWDETLSQIHEIVWVEEELTVALLHVFKQLRESTAIREQHLNNIQQELINFFDAPKIDLIPTSHYLFFLFFLSRWTP